MDQMRVKAEGRIERRGRRWVCVHADGCRSVVASKAEALELLAQDEPVWKTRLMNEMEEICGF